MYGTANGRVSERGLYVVRGTPCVYGVDLPPVIIWRSSLIEVLMTILGPNMPHTLPAPKDGEVASRVQLGARTDEVSRAALHRPGGPKASSVADIRSHHGRHGCRTLRS